MLRVDTLLYQATMHRNTSDFEYNLGHVTQIILTQQRDFYTNLYCQTNKSIDFNKSEILQYE